MHPLTHVVPPCKRSERLKGGSTTLWNASLTLCFWLFETTTIELVVGNIAEVDATGRYIPFPLVCRWLTMPSRTPLGTYYIYQRRGYHSVCLQLRLWKASNCETGRSQIPRFSICSRIKGLLRPIWVFCGRQID